MPGPGAYDLNFRDELKTLDQKYSQRYKKNPFGAKAPRFSYKKEVQENKQNEIVSLDDKSIQKDKSLTRVFIDDTIEKMKQDEARKPGYQFKSSSKRFDEISPSRKVGKVDKPSLIPPIAKKLTENEPNSDYSKTSLMGQYMKNLNAPFNSISPRFNYTKDTMSRMENPGPGSYSVKPQKVSVTAEESSAFRASSRDKYSLFGKLIKNSNKIPGAGTYNNLSTIAKKTFNANLG